MTNTFSSIPLHQAHEQNNELIKGDGEAIGITETPGALLMDGGWTGADKIGKRVWEYSRGGQHRPDLHPLPWAIQGLSSGFHKSCSMVLRSPPTTRRNKLSPCSHEEVDARMMVHIADAVQDGHQSVMIRSTETHLVALVAATLDLKELWVSYGTRKNHRILLAHLFAKAPCPSK